MGEEFLAEYWICSESVLSCGFFCSFSCQVLAHSVLCHKGDMWPHPVMSTSRVTCTKPGEILFIYFYRGEGREKEGEKHRCVVPSQGAPLGMWPTTQACALTGNQTNNPLVRRPALNPLSHTGQGPREIFSVHKGNGFKGLPTS